MENIRHSPCICSTRLKSYFTNNQKSFCLGRTKYLSTKNSIINPCCVHVWCCPLAIVKIKAARSQIMYLNVCFAGKRNCLPHCHMPVTMICPRDRQHLEDLRERGQSQFQLNTLAGSNCLWKVHWQMSTSHRLTDKAGRKHRPNTSVDPQIGGRVHKTSVKSHYMYTFLQLLIQTVHTQTANELMLKISSNGVWPEHAWKGLMPHAETVS